jgi:hypothetical protein
MGETYQATYTEQINQEVKQMPDEYLPVLLEVIRIFRRTVTLKSAEESFRQGWQEATRGETLPLSDLWVDVDAQ